MVALTSQVAIVITWLTFACVAPQCAGRDRGQIRPERLANPRQ
jgi:hypothetical protein